MLKSVSVSPSLSPHFKQLSGKTGPEWFATHDPVDQRLGSGGGSLHLLRETWRNQQTNAESPTRFVEWLKQEHGVLLHAGGQSRRLPAYAAEGKTLIPIPVFRWARGQRINQTLLDLQMPFLERTLQAVPLPSGHWLVASGDVLLHADSFPDQLPAADVIALGIWGDPEQATRHGVFFTPRNNPECLNFMLQKPDIDAIRAASREHYFLLDVGVWILGPRAIDVLLRCALDGSDPESGTLRDYDLYGQFGLSLGNQPKQPDNRISSLSTALIPLDGGIFYHFGSGADLIDSNLMLQNRVIDQRRISSSDIKPHPSLFVQNSIVAKGVLSEANARIWIENSHIGAGWHLSVNHVLTGIPENDWQLPLSSGQCLEIIPLKSGGIAIRPYGMQDPFRGSVGAPTTTYCGYPFVEWLAQRHLRLADLEISPQTDLQSAAIFPVFDDLPDANFMRWLLNGAADQLATIATPETQALARRQYLQCQRVSAEDISKLADLQQVQATRKLNLSRSLPILAANAQRSVFYQVDLEHLAPLYAATETPLPTQRPDARSQLFNYVHDAMFRAHVSRNRGDEVAAGTESARAFAALRTAMIQSAKDDPVKPSLDCLDDQIIWARSPVRLDLAGGWTDTPPYCFLNGGKVINLAVELNGQPPIQVFVKPRPEGGIKLRSIDLGVSQEIHDFNGLQSFAEIGSGFAIPKAALALCGFLPDFNADPHAQSLNDLLADFGCGIEISLLCAVPKGSGLGTSSILAATVLGALNEFCQLGWDTYAIAQRVLVLEQMLTSGGGWQDQFGGICRGLKYMETRPGLSQIPRIHWLDDHLFTDPSLQPNVLLYYTGITRTAKNVLAEIVRGMFLNSRQRLAILEKIGENATRLLEEIQQGDYAAMGASIRRSWQLNQALDSGTNTPEVEQIFTAIDPWLLGGKLLGAGGGGYLLLLAKDSSCAQRIKEFLQQNPPNERARFVTPSLSRTGLQVTRS